MLFKNNKFVIFNVFSFFLKLLKEIFMKYIYITLKIQNTSKIVFKIQNANALKVFKILVF